MPPPSSRTYNSWERKSRIDHISVEYKEFNEIFGDYWEFIEKDEDTKKIFKGYNEFNAEKKKKTEQISNKLCVLFGN